VQGEGHGGARGRGTSWVVPAMRATTQAGLMLKISSPNAQREMESGFYAPAHPFILSGLWNENL
jgi:hypothetical protein